MFKVLKNPEVKKEFVIYAAVSALMGVGCFVLSMIAAYREGTGSGAAMLLGLAAGICVLFLGLFFALTHLYFSAKRYGRISELSESIDNILHDTDAALKADNSEGELAILVSEIQKMTVMLKGQTDLLQADKIRLTDAIADIFHQIRTPLTSMNLIVTLLSDEDLSYEKRVSLTRDLKKQLERTRWLIESLLKLSKIDAGTAVFASEEVIVKELIKKAAEPFLIQMELRGQEFRAEAGEEKFTGDLAWSVEAIGNIIKNAMEHTPDGGRISVYASETPIFTQITVEDSGEGFCEEDIPRLFERFYKGKNAGEGSIGIGLALSRAIIAAQNGTVKANNSASGGACFTVRFYKNIV